MAHQVTLQRGFTGPRLAQDVNMLKSVDVVNTEWFIFTSADGGANHGEAVRVSYHAANMKITARVNYTILLRLN